MFKSWSSQLRLMSKATSVVRRELIHRLEYCDTGIYMRHYVRYLRSIGMVVEGTPKYIHPTARFDGVDYRLIRLGDNITISRDVLFLTHDYAITSALAGLGQRIDRGHGELYVSRPITIGENCFIGARSTLLPGSTIGANVIVGAGSVVRGSIPDNAIYAGNPARRIGDSGEWAQRMLRDPCLRVEK